MVFGLSGEYGDHDEREFGVTLVELILVDGGVLVKGEDVYSLGRVGGTEESFCAGVVGGVIIVDVRSV